MTDPVAQNRSVDERQIRALERAYDEAWTAGDIDRVMTLFTPDAVVVNPYGRIASGVAEIESALRSFLTGDALSTTHTSAVKAVRFVSSDVALVDGEATIERAALPGYETTSPPLHSFTDVFVKRDGVWRICQVRAYTFAK